jgi:Tol biopolymer transport system component
MRIRIGRRRVANRGAGRALLPGCKGGRIGTRRSVHHLILGSLATLVVALLPFVAPAQATFPGENGKLALDTQREHRLISTVNPDGSGLTDLTNGVAQSGGDEDAYGAAWSPDGEKLAFTSRDRSAGISRLEVMDADGSNRETIFQDDQSLVDPTWSPDGSKILFVKADYYQGGLWVIAANGSAPAPVPLSGDLPRTFAAPDWSPDGSRVAFEGQADEEYCDPYDPPECYPILGAPAIYIVSSSGGAVTRLTEYGGESEDPSWSPDGSRIAVFAYGSIWTVDPSGTNFRDLGPYGSNPVWSPDGELIAFLRPDGFFPNVGYDVSVMRADGTGLATVVDGGTGPSSTYKTPHTPTSWQPVTNQPPDCSAVTAAPALLWPPNKNFRLAGLAGATDPDRDRVTLEVTGVTQDEPIRGARDAQHSVGDDNVRLRADRDPRGDGRVYTIAFEATDGRGGSCEGGANVSVPRHRRVAAVDSAPPSYDSFGH